MLSCLHTCDACVITNWRLGLPTPLIFCNKQRQNVSEFISQDQSAQVSDYFGIATCLQLMNMSRIVILYLTCIFISCSFAKNGYEESKPGNKKQNSEESESRKNVNIQITISTWL